MEELIRRLEDGYGFKINAVTAVRRGFWAEAYRIESGGSRYFLKIHRGYPWESALLGSLEIQVRLSKRFTYIPTPVFALDKSPYLRLNDGGIASVYSFIEGENYLAKNAAEALRLMSGIYASGIICSERFTYKLYARDIIEKWESDGIKTGSRALNDYLDEYRGVYLGNWRRYTELYDKYCVESGKRYLTHGDIAKNLMRRLDGQVCIIDWDRIRMGEIEMDLREFTDSSSDTGELDKIAADAGIEWNFDGDRHNYYVLNDLYYYFRNLMKSDVNNITESDLSGYREYADKIGAKLINK